MFENGLMKSAKSQYSGFEFVKIKRSTLVHVQYTTNRYGWILSEQYKRIEQTHTIHKTKNSY